MVRKEIVMDTLKKFWSKYSYLIFLTFVVLGLFDFRFAVVAVVCMISPIFLSLLGKGRYWCGNLCPRGNFYDRVLSKIAKKNRTSKFLNSSYFRLLVIIIMFTVFGKGLYNNWGDFYGIGLLFYRMIVVTTLIGITLSFSYNSRVWCSFCPMGSISAFITKIRGNKNSLEINDSCVECKLCEKKCPMGIIPYKYKENGSIDHYDCIQCKQCSFVCPKNSIK